MWIIDIHLVLLIPITSFTLSLVLLLAIGLSLVMLRRYSFRKHIARPYEIPHSCFCTLLSNRQTEFKQKEVYLQKILKMYYQTRYNVFISVKTKCN